MNPTPNQQRAIQEQGNLLVMAAAGAGKTGTLVQRCLRLLLRAERPVPVRNILVVTFTEAAAAEVRERIRQKLEAAAAEMPQNEHLQTQLANIDSAYISTLHSFCFQLVRRHVLELDLDPAVSVLEPHQARMYFHNTLDLLLREHYEGAHESSADVKELIRAHYGGWAKPVRDFVEQFHEFTQTRPNPDAWFQNTLRQLEQTQCEPWRQWRRAALTEWCEYWAPYLEKLPPENTNAAACALLLRNALQMGDAAVATEILARDGADCWPKRKKEAHRKPFSRLFDEAGFLESLQSSSAGQDPLDEDWRWMRGPLQMLLRLAQQFSDRFRADKLERGVVDFHDLEQFALRLLVDPATLEPTALAREWQGKFEAVFVDEYQDINAAQDLILTALSSSVSPGNRFLVGDVKQSIYRFRQADPSIFQQYMQCAGWQTISLSENFRSHQALLEFINPLFRWLMRPAFGGVAYDDEAALKVGSPEERSAMLNRSGEPAHVEFHLLKTGEEAERDENNEEIELENAEVEARWVAQRLRQLKESGFTFYDQRQRQERVVEWSDMVVLLRAAKNRLETYAKAFAAAGVPLQTKRSLFFTTQEVLDLCNVLHLLDNPLQDIPLAGVLRSPIVGLTAEELALIRLHSKADSFWFALKAVAERPGPSAEAVRPKISLFLERFGRWRDGHRSSSLAQRLELILSDTGYEDGLLAQARGRERVANVHQLVRIARQFDESRGESLYLFLRHLEELQDSAGDIEPAGCVEENSVRLMTVHQSKGLEFPVVALADLGKTFNFSDQTKSVMIHDRFGLCSTVKPPHTGQRYPSLPLWLARRAERFETYGEEMRVLYVALTRAQNHLLLFGSCTKNQPERWKERAGDMPFSQQVFQHRSWLDWIGTFAELQQGKEGGWKECSVIEHSGGELEEPQPAPVAPRLDRTGLNFAVPYPHEAATRQAAKTSVTALRREADADEESAGVPLRFRGDKDGKARGLATHKFLEHLPLDGPMDLPGLEMEAKRQVERKILTEEEKESIDLAAVSAFWTSKVGRELAQRRGEVRRELPFTFKARLADLQEAGLAGVVSVPADDFVIIQGVADLVLLAREEIWLIDFKSDQVGRAELKAAADRYKPQLALYAVALGAIYGRPVARQGIFFLHSREFFWFESPPPKPRKPQESGQLELF